MTETAQSPTAHGAANPTAAGGAGVAAAPPTPRAGRAPVLSGAGLLALLLCAALPILDFFIVNVALPSMGRELRAGPALLELVVAGYGVAFAVLLVLGGRLGDTFGRRRLLLIAMTAFTLSSIACGLAPNAAVLVGARILQGASAALLNPQVLATLHATTSGDRRNRALSLYGAMAGLAMVAGQILGGLLVAADIGGAGWRAVFLVNGPVGVIAFILAWRTVPATRSDRPAPVDLAGTALLAITLTALLVPLSEGRAAGWPLWSWLCLAACPIAAVALLVVERRQERAGRLPLLPPSLFGFGGVRLGLGLIVPFSINFGGFMFVMAIALQQGLRFGPVQAGLTLAPLAVTHLLASLVSPRLIGRFGSRVIQVAASIHLIALVVLGVTVLRGWPDLTALDFAPALALWGVASGSQIPVFFRIVLADLPADRAGIGSGVLVTFQQASFALGAAVIGTLFLSLETAQGDPGKALAETVAALAALVLLTLTLSTRLPRRL
ncbi:MFS transporter [Kribbella ginsengisoli]|uniref:MFS transporter n=1 Tax=Kribbella ginsengisoli TaxID=363865 RepID=A0ABP6XLQ1_9ACTN